MSSTDCKGVSQDLKNALYKMEKKKNPCPAHAVLHTLHTSHLDIVKTYNKMQHCKTQEYLKYTSRHIPVTSKVPIPVTQDLDPLTMLTDDADIATWQNEGLPADRMSTENATILTSCQRWPLMVDPQLQGIKWIKNKYGDNLQVIRIGQKG